ncbi:helix-turn-helix domain-containing protein [Pseudonocardia humida]|uniref:Helix-turn-helix transcriptional regulator n=1 Tax=Pseudonocardia humida TaxID=2800819 RepID=A0ABT1A5S8_9PSEU|nr:helix-turn-helix transcriptional regulator [Pseudonocardia humida]MCO1658184.1 helix-turn-helix transcriptional regulator [Pseudonocardia humida]
MTRTRPPRRGPAPGGEPTVTALRAARSARGWSQSEAARRLAALGRERGAPVAAAASLKTQLSRWENGHALPDPPYRELLTELYGRPAAELGLAAHGADIPDADGPGRLRTALAEAAAAARAGAAPWWDQLAAAARLDDELGAAGAGALVDAQIERLSEIVAHAVDPGPRAGLAAVLSAAAALGAAQSLDRGHHDLAWRRYDRSLAAAREAAVPEAVAAAVAGQAEVLVDAGEPAAAVALLGSAAPGAGSTAEVRLAGAMAVAAAAAGDRAAATRAIDDARHRWSEVVDVVTPLPGLRIDVADVHRWHGHALAELGDRAAAAPLHRALDVPQRSVRHRAAVHADLARVLGEAEPALAAEHAATARELATGIGSARVAGRLARPLPTGRAT